jgi:putative hydrolase of the HAD superfamily
VSPSSRPPAQPRVWLFDLDDTLHDASTASMPHLHVSFGDYIQTHLGLTQEEADALRRRYWLRYGATLLGLTRHHGVRAAHFLHHTHLLPGLEARVRGHGADLSALARLPGRRLIFTNADDFHAERVLNHLGLTHLFDEVFHIHSFGFAPKPDPLGFTRMIEGHGLDPAATAFFEDSERNLKPAHDLGMTTVLVTHDAAEAQVMAQRGFRLVAGQLQRLW